jgi:phosphoglycolate phosphatase-like HAD superfamily hydrolase
MLDAIHSLEIGFLSPGNNFREPEPAGRRSSKICDVGPMRIIQRGPAQPAATKKATMALKHIVFDCDGVLWQGTNEGYFTCYHRAALEAGIELDFQVAKERILKNWGQSAQLEIEGMLPDHPDLVPEVMRRYHQLVRSDLFLKSASLIPGADRTLQELAQRHALSAITGMNAENLKTLLARFHLRHLFRHALSTSETNEPEKQKSTGYHLGQLLEQERLAPDEVLCVGDAIPDVQMARRQQVPIVVVLTGHLTEPQARDLGVQGILPSVAHLPRWLGVTAL